jgi:hypothetical protein
MKSTIGVAATILLTALVAGLGGWTLSRGNADARILELREQMRELEREKQEAVELAALAESRMRAEREDRAAEPPLPEATGPVAAAATGEADPIDADAKGPTPAERLRRVREIGAAADGWFAEGKGEQALAALKELAALVPEGREAAMALALRINSDVSGKGELGLSEMIFYTNLGDPAVVKLFGWSLKNPSTPAGFRVMAAYSLPWTQSQEATVAMFGAALEREEDLGVQRALVGNLARMRKPEAEKALAEVFGDPGRPAALRAQIVTELATTENPEILRAIESAAHSDPDPAVRDAAAAAKAIRNPPATGFMVTGTLPRSQAEAAGMKAGDILVSYGGSPTRSLADLRAAAGREQESGTEVVEVVVIRGGSEVTLLLRPGQMGIFGREVASRND